MRTLGPDAAVSTLSGGNQQKVIIARELTGDPKLLVVAQPTRGLDVGSIEFIHREIVRLRDAGAAVLLVSAELDEVLNLADRIGVIYRGRARRHVRPRRRHPRAPRAPHGLRARRRGPRRHEPAAPCSTPPGSSRSYVPLLAVLVAVVLAGLLILAVGKNPLEADWALLRGMFGSGDRVAASLARSTPFIGGALAVAFAFRAGLFNIGVEGQILVGATTAAWVGTFGWLADLPGPLLIPIILVAGAARRRAVGRRSPGVLKVRTGAHEVIVTIMLNSVAVLYVRWLVGSTDPVVLRDTGGVGPPHRPDARRRPATRARRQRAPDSTSASSCCWSPAGLVYVVLKRTTFGFEVRTVGTNPNAAKYAGMGVEPHDRRW